MPAFLRVLKWGIGIGFLCFIPGFFGPMILAPGATQGPLLGILYTGPIGLILGLGVGVWREWRRNPGDLPDRAPAPKRPLPRWDELLTHPLSRVVAGLLALIFLVKGIEGLREGAGRGAGSAVVIAGILGWFSLTAKLPSIVRRRG